MLRYDYKVECHAEKPSEQGAVRKTNLPFEEAMQLYSDKLLTTRISFSTRFNSVHSCPLSVTDEWSWRIAVSRKNILGYLPCKFNTAFECNDVDMYTGLSSSDIVRQKRLRATHDPLRDVLMTLTEKCMHCIYYVDL